MENAPPNDLPETDSQGRKLVLVKVKKRKKNKEPQPSTSKSGSSVRRGQEIEHRNPTASCSSKAIFPAEGKSTSTSTEYYKLRRKVKESKPMVYIYQAPDSSQAEVSRRFVLGCDTRRESRDVWTDYRADVHQHHKDTQADCSDDLAQLQLYSFGNKKRLESVDKSEQAGHTPRRVSDAWVSCNTEYRAPADEIFRVTLSDHLTESIRQLQEVHSYEELLTPHHNTEYIPALHVSKSQACGVDRLLCSATRQCPDLRRDTQAQDPVSSKPMVIRAKNDILKPNTIPTVVVNLLEPMFSSSKVRSIRSRNFKSDEKVLIAIHLPITAYQNRISRSVEWNSNMQHSQSPSCNPTIVTVSRQTSVQCNLEASTQGRVGKMSSKKKSLALDSVQFSVRRTTLATSSDFLRRHSLGLPTQKLIAHVSQGQKQETHLSYRSANTAVDLVPLFYNNVVIDKQLVKTPFDNTHSAPNHLSMTSSHITRHSPGPYEDSIFQKLRRGNDETEKLKKEIILQKYKHPLGYADHQRVAIPHIQTATERLATRLTVLPIKKHCLELKRARPLKKMFKEIPVVDDEVVYVPNEVCTEEEWKSLKFVEKVGSPIHDEYYRRSSLSSNRRRSAPLISYTGYLRQKTLPTTFYSPRAKFTSRLNFGRSVISEIHNPQYNTETTLSTSLGLCDTFTVLNGSPESGNVVNPSLAAEATDCISFAQLCARSRRASKALIRKARHQQMDLSGFSTGLLAHAVPYEKADVFDNVRSPEDALMELHDTLRPDAGRRFRSRRRSSILKERFL